MVIRNNFDYATTDSFKNLHKISVPFLPLGNNLNKFRTCQRGDAIYKFEGFRHTGYRLEDILKLSLCKHMQNI